jgi:hypothetical protein
MATKPAAPAPSQPVRQHYRLATTGKTTPAPPKSPKTPA